MSGHRFYEEGEAEEILRRALQQPDASNAPVDRSRLLSMAAELGISEEAINRAESQMAAERDSEIAAKRTDLDRIAFKRHRQRGFWNDASSYLGVNAFLIVIWWMTGHGYFWPGWVLACWGFAVISDFFGAFFGFSERDFERWQRKRARKAAKAAGEAEVSAFLDTIYPEMKDAKLNMIKEVRERFGLDLAESKDFVDEYVASKRK